MLHAIFTSFAHPGHKLDVAQRVDSDLSLLSYDVEGPDHAQVRLCTVAGGGRNTLLWSSLHALFDATAAPSPIQAPPTAFATFHVPCDSNPGSHLRIALADDALGLQTVCHDEAANHRSGDIMSCQGEGPMVWLTRVTAPACHEDLRRILIDGWVPGHAAHRRHRVIKLAAPGDLVPRPQAK